MLLKLLADKLRSKSPTPTIFFSMACVCIIFAITALCLYLCSLFQFSSMQNLFLFLPLLLLLLASLFQDIHPTLLCQYGCLPWCTVFQWSLKIKPHTDVWCLKKESTQATNATMVSSHQRKWIALDRRHENKGQGWIKATSVWFDIVYRSMGQWKCKPTGNKRLDV